MKNADLFVGEHKEQGIPQFVLAQHPLHCSLISSSLSLSREFTHIPRVPR